MGRLTVAVLVPACLAVAALSLAGPRALAFDPQAWVAWGRDIAAGDLTTDEGPSWKPLPVLFTAPFALTGGLAPDLWLVVSRAGGLLALAGAARLAWALAGPAAAAGAALVMALGPWWAYNVALGNSEGLLAAATLWAVVAHLEGRYAVALALGLAAALLRPEAWPFLFLYALWLRRNHEPARRVALAAMVAVPVLWLAPDLLGSGGAVRASAAASGSPSPGSAALAPVPALAVLEDAAVLLSLPALVAAAAGVARGGRPERVLAAGASAWIVLVAVMTEAAYAGNPRYLVAAVAIGCVLAGVGAARLARGHWVAPVVLAAAVALASGGSLLARLGEVGEREALRRGLDGVIAAAGGPVALRACGTTRTSQALGPLVAWRLGVPLRHLDDPPRTPGILLRSRYPGHRRTQPRLTPAMRRSWRLVARDGRWELWTTCRGFTPSARPSA